MWLWVWPSLLGWPHEITWLFSPVVGKRPWPGDLWGVDAAGDLLIVEAKWAGTTGTDPFEDFVGYSVPPIDQLINHWRESLAGEHAFLRDYASDLQEGRLARAKYPGVIPYSYKRIEVRRWRHLYLNHIVPLFNGDYERRVEANLNLYQAAGCPPPNYIALFTLRGNGRAALSERGKDNYRNLETDFGAEHIHMFAVQAGRASESVESCEIQSYAVHLPEV